MPINKSRDCAGDIGNDYSGIDTMIASVRQDISDDIDGRFRMSDSKFPIHRSV